jgi:hypothetical protein
MARRKIQRGFGSVGEKTRKRFVAFFFIEDFSIIFSVLHVFTFFFRRKVQYSVSIRGQQGGEFFSDDIQPPFKDSQ